MSPDYPGNSAYPCPVCHTLTNLEHPCPGCGRAPDPDAAAVITLDVRIQTVQAERDEAKRRWEELNAQLLNLHMQREAHASAVRAAIAATTVAAPTVRAPSPSPFMAPPPSPVLLPGPPEASPKTVQTLLFVLGGIILGIAAIVFTGVAFTRFGLVGRAAILGTITLIILSVPPLVRRRGLTGTAETFAALGLLFVLLDGFAAWGVNLFGVQQRLDLTFYTAVVFGVAAFLGAFYGRAFDLVGPRIAALVLAQPVLPLAFAKSNPSVEVWTLVLAAMGLGNVVVVWRLESKALRVLAWVLHGAALMVAGLFAIVVLSTQQNVMSSVAVMAVAVVFAAGAWVGGQFPHRCFAGGVLAVALGAAVVRPLLSYFVGPRDIVVWAAVAAAVAVLAWSLSARVKPAPAAPAAVVLPETQPVDERIPALWSTFDPAKPAPPPAATPEPSSPQDPWALGARFGAGIGLLGPAFGAMAWALWLGLKAIVDALPWWHATAVTPVLQWELPIAVLLVASAGVLVLRSVEEVRDTVLVVAAISFALTLPWASIVDIVVAVGLIVWTLAIPSRTVLKTSAALLLLAHALLAGQGDPQRAMLVMAAIVAIGFSTGTAAPRRGLRRVGGTFAGLTDLLFPWLAFTTVAAFGGNAVASWRMLLAFVIMVPILGTPRQYRGYLVVAGLISSLYPLWPELPPGESQALYAAGASVAAAIVVFRCAWTWARWAATVPILATLAWTAGDWDRALPSTPVSEIWLGFGVTPTVELDNAIALTVLLVPVVALCWRLGRRNAFVIGGFAAVLPVLMWLAVAGAPWPVLPAVTLLFGLSTVVVGVLRRMPPVFAVIGALLTLSGVSGAAQEKWTTIVALSLVVVAMGVVAIGAASQGARLAGWISGAAAKVLLAYTIGETANLRPEMTAYLVLLAAGMLLALAFSPLVRDLRPAVEAAAHSAALVALTFTAGHARAGAGVFAIWGVAIGLTALRSRPVPRAAFAGAAEAIAWILVLRSYDVGNLEAYTLPIALIAVVVGVLSARNMSSWLAYGPALAAALLPSLGAVMLTSEQLWRRLLLGFGALIVVVAGAVWRKQAPFILGGLTLILLALHEIVLIWKYVQTWIPLTIIGLILVGLAITYERRRRDLIRLRTSITHMT